MISSWWCMLTVNACPSPLLCVGQVLPLPAVLVSGPAAQPAFGGVALPVWRTGAAQVASAQRWVA